CQMVVCRLNITTSCNFSCKHCHVRNYNKPPIFMDFTTMDASISSVLNLHKKNQTKHITFSIYGGEPLLNKIPLFKAIEKYGNNYEGIAISWIINTNGTLLKEKDLEFLKKYNVDIHLSLDGPKEVHNLTRIDQKGSPTYERAISGLKKVTKYNLPVQINSYVMPTNIAYLKSLVDIAYKHKVKRIYLDWLYTKKKHLHPTIIVKEYIKTLKYAQLKGISISGPWSRTLYNIQNDKTVNYINQNLLNSVEFTPEGRFFFKIFPLTRKHPFKLKHLHEILNTTRANEFLRACENYFQHKCDGCSIKEHCLGASIAQYQYHTNEETGYANICESTRKLIESLTKTPKNKTLNTIQANITYNCNRNCSYCYVKDFLNENHLMSLSDFNSLLQWLENNGIKRINLTGGEPTTHPQFKNMVKLAYTKGFLINIFSNFVFNSSLYETLNMVNGFLINIGKKEFYTKKEYENLCNNLKRFGNARKITINFCIDEQIDSCEHIIEICKKHKIDNVLIDVTHPNSLSTNSHVKNEEFIQIKNKLMNFIKEFVLNYINIKFARPFPLCIFSPEERNYLETGHGLHGTCGTGRELVSVNPDLRIFPCLSLFIKGPKITRFKSQQDYYNYYEKSIHELKWERFLFKECKACSFREAGECQGSCLCRKSKGFQVIKKPHFSLYTQYNNAGNYPATIQQVMQTLDKHFPRTKKFEFFQFDNKKDLFLYSNTYKYPSWVSGFTSNNAYYQFGFTENKSRLTHEICHLYIENLSSTSIPNWLNEGICEYMAYGKEVDTRLLKLMGEKTLIPFEKMKGLYDKSLLEFDNSHPLENIAYQQSASLVYFIIKKFGFKTIINLLQAKKDFYEAVKYETGNSFSRLAGKWKKELTLKQKKF
ncbi:MAG: radical SAM protein, partial [Candidatus Nanoarchaeia archaeon]